MPHEVLAMKLVKEPKIEVGSLNISLQLPAGAAGIMYVFKTKKAARDYYGKDVSLIRIEQDSN